MYKRKRTGSFCDMVLTFSMSSSIFPSSSSYLCLFYPSYFPLNGAQRMNCVRLTRGGEQKVKHSTVLLDSIKAKRILVLSVRSAVRPTSTP